MDLRVLVARCFSRSRRSSADIEEELAAHLEMAATELYAQGMSRPEAQRQARLRFGGATQTAESYRQQSRPPLLDSIVADLLYAARQLRRNPGFATVAILTLAIGIGATTAVYSLLDSILLQPLPFTQQNSLVMISGGYPKGWVRAVQQRTRTLAGLMSYSFNVEHNVEGTSGPERIFAANVTSNAFSVLGVTPILGRSFSQDEAVAGHDHVVLLSDGYWKQRFGGDPHVLGRSLRIDGAPYTVIGVMPAHLDFPDVHTSMWLPISFKSGDPIDPWAFFSGTMIGRMRPGVVPRQVQAEMRTLHPQLLGLFPWPMPAKWNADVTATPLLLALVEDTRPRLFLLLAAVAILLLTACANVANLMIARASTRSDEFAVRSALGASSRRLIRQMLTESLLLGTVAAALGLLISMLALFALKALLPADLPRLAEVRTHPQVLLFLVALTFLTTALFGLVPALQLRARALQASMQAGQTTHSPGRDRSRMTSLLVVAQMALAVTAIASAALMLHSLWRLVHVDPGFHSQNTLTARVSLDSSRCESDAQKNQCAVFYNSLMTRLEQQAGTQQVALVSMLPMSGEDNYWAFDAAGHPRDPRQTPDQASNRVVSPGYFTLMGIPLERGRFLDTSDSSGSTHALVISRGMAERLWPGADPLGKQIELVGREQQQGRLDRNALTVVGVVGNTHHTALDTRFGDEMYTSLTPTSVTADMSIVLRTTASPTVAAAAMRRIVASLDSGAPLSQIASLASLLRDSTASQRSLSGLLTGFALLVAAIGCVGVYSLSAYMVTMRTTELGIRIALGASRSTIASLVLKHSLRLACIGGSLGLLTAVITAHLMRSFLYATTPLDPVALACVGLSLLCISLVACSAPAWRAAHVEPVHTLRSQ